MRNRVDKAAALARGRKVSAEMYTQAIRAVTRISEAAGEDADPTINAITARYLTLMNAAEEAARFEVGEQVPRYGGASLYERARDGTVPCTFCGNALIGGLGAPIKLGTARSLGFRPCR